MDQTALLTELEPIAASLLDKHLAAAKEWFPHALVPWSRGRDFEPDETWSPDDAPLDPLEARAIARSAAILGAH